MTPLQKSRYLSEKYNADIWLKREDLNEIRSYKIRGAKNFLEKSTIPKEGVVTASAGNHAQGVAYVCAELNVKCKIYMPRTTPKQKVEKVKYWGKTAEIILIGDSYDECEEEAKKQIGLYVPPFDHELIIEGQANVVKEILSEMSFDTLIVPIGGGGLAAGAAITLPSNIDLITCEPAGAPSFSEALKAGHPVKLDKIDSFVDGASVKKVGLCTFAACQNRVNQHFLIENGSVCATMIELYNQEGIVVEPAGALSVAVLEKYANSGKKIVCVISGGNNDLSRMAEIQERALQYKGLRHYFLIYFASRAGALKEFVQNVLVNDEDIVRFEFIKKTNRENGAALVGLELKKRDDLPLLLNRMKLSGIRFTDIEDSMFYEFLI